MSVFIHMKGALEPLEVNGDFLVTISQLELANQRGLSFMVLRSEPDKVPMAVQIAEITSLRQGADYTPTTEDDD